MPGPINYIKEINRVLKIGGMLYLAVPNESALIFKFRNLIFKLLGNKLKSNSFQPFQHPYHINGFTRSSLIRLLEKNKFCVIKYRNYAGWYEFLKYRFLSKGFIKNALLLPVHILAVFLRMEYYQDVICKKVGEIKEDRHYSEYSIVDTTKQLDFSVSNINNSIIVFVYKS